MIKKNIPRLNIFSVNKIINGDAWVILNDTETGNMKEVQIYLFNLGYAWPISRTTKRFIDVKYFVHIPGIINIKYKFLHGSENLKKYKRMGITMIKASELL